MSIASALESLQTDITNARSAITTKGGTVTSGGGSSQLATDIATIPTGITPSGNKAITATTATQTGIDVTSYATVSVAPTPSETGSATPSETAQTVSPPSGKLLSSVSVGAISSSYVGSAIPRKSSTDLTVSGATVTVPSGYYSADASKAVASGTQGTPTATKTISNHTATVTPSCTDTTGYISGTTKSGTAVTVTADELVSDTLSITANGETDVTNYEKVNVNVPTSGGNPHSNTWDFAARTELRLYRYDSSYAFNAESPNEYMLWLPTDDTCWINGAYNISQTTGFIHNGSKSGASWSSVSSVTSNGLVYTSATGSTTRAILVPYFLKSGQTFSITYTRSGSNYSGYIWCDKHGRYVSSLGNNRIGSGTETWTYTATEDGWLYWSIGKYDGGASVTLSNCSVTIS